MPTTTTTTSRRCATPACSSEIPEQLDEYGPRGWNTFTIELAPMGRGFERRVEFLKVRLCPACSLDPSILVSLAINAILA